MVINHLLTGMILQVAVKCQLNVQKTRAFNDVQQGLATGISQV